MKVLFLIVIVFLGSAFCGADEDAAKSAVLKLFQEVNQECVEYISEENTDSFKKVLWKKAPLSRNIHGDWKELDEAESAYQDNLKAKTHIKALI